MREETCPLPPLQAVERPAAVAAVEGGRGHRRTVVPLSHWRLKADLNSFSSTCIHTLASFFSLPLFLSNMAAGSNFCCPQVFSSSNFFFLCFVRNRARGEIRVPFGSWYGRKYLWASCHRLPPALSGKAPLQPTTDAASPKGRKGRGSYLYHRPTYLYISIYPCMHAKRNLSLFLPT